MSFIIRAVSVYSKLGKVRSVTFRPTGLNVLTGQSKTGKSSVIDIIDYCCGRSECLVAAGVIREHVSWFGLEIENRDEVLFVGRRNPDPGRGTSEDIHVRRGRHEAPPRLDQLVKNTNRKGLVRLLSRFAGIAENEHRPIGGTRNPLQATIRHALFLCFQRQDEIAGRDRMFHRQGEQHIPQAIKDTMRYFLGAVDEEHLFRQDEVDRASKALKQAEARRMAMASERDRGHDGIGDLVRDARRVGLTEEYYEGVPLDRLVQSMRSIVSSDIQSPAIVSRGGDVIAEIEDDIRALHEELLEVKDVIRTTRHFLREQDRYSREVGEQRHRLMALDLYVGASEDGEWCPVCESRLDTPTPAAEDLARSLQILDEQLEAVGGERPYLRERLEEYGKRRAEIERVIVARQGALERAYSEDERARRARDEIVERARVVGRIAAFLDQVDVGGAAAALDVEIEQLKTRVAMLSEHVRREEVEEMVVSFVNLISEQMTEYAKELDLEHVDGRLRLDLARLSVIADTARGPIPLHRIGSAENWVGYHVVTMLALHQWFRAHERPVPGFLVLDQPSQAHYPPEGDRRIETGVDDADREAVRKMFSFMNERSRSYGTGFQLIVLDHAHIDEEWFDNAIVEEWRDGHALVPAEWYRDAER